VIVSLVGLDDTFSQTVHARHTYAAADLIWTARFADVLTLTPEGCRVDYSRGAVCHFKWP
jgi:inward rectifier potassium channel